MPPCVSSRGAAREIPGNPCPARRRHSCTTPIRNLGKRKPAVLLFNGPLCSLIRDATGSDGDGGPWARDFWFRTVPIRSYGAWAEHPLWSGGSGSRSAPRLSRQSTTTTRTVARRRRAAARRPSGEEPSDAPLDDAAQMPPPPQRVRRGLRFGPCLIGHRRRVMPKGGGT